MTRLADIAPQDARIARNVGTPFDQALRSRGRELLRPCLCGYCGLRWCEAGRRFGEHCPFCGCDRNGFLA